MYRGWLRGIHLFFIQCLDQHFFSSLFGTRHFRANSQQLLKNGANFH